MGEPFLLADSSKDPGKVEHKAATQAANHMLNETQTVSVFGVTNRKISPDGKSFQSLKAGKDSDVHYYRQDVPLATDDGEKSFFADKADGKVTMLSKGEFDAQVAADVARHNGRVGVFIPGLRNGPGESAFNAAQISLHSGETFVVEDWSSSAKAESGGPRDTLAQVDADTISSYQSQPMINESVVSLIHKFGGDKIDLVSHSKGAVNELRLMALLQATGESPVGSATFTHPDIEVSDFNKAFPYLYKGANHMNIISGTSDWAVWLSSQKNYYTRDAVTMPDGATLSMGNNLGNVGLGDKGLKSITSQYVGNGYFNWLNEKGTGTYNHKPVMGNLMAMIQHHEPGQDLQVARQADAKPSVVASAEEKHNGKPHATPVNYAGFGVIPFPVSLSREKIADISRWRNMVSASPEVLLQSSRARETVVADDH